ncbi:MAG: pyridoxal phosphate-dependent aminotransferase [Acidobacteria bacterium]|nr:pyridoxal phosphate-dependent aminotransferase [Acidobacteriota bacterium]MBI3263084.1 pyridoxal phosphate-dependent aminotransferase [Acidobacteriota bacterium]
MKGTPALAERMGKILTSGTLQVALDADRLRRQGVDVVDLGAGEPDFPTPVHVKAAAIAGIESNFTKYTPAAGIAELKQAVCDRYQQDYGVRYDTSEVIVTAGGKQAIFNAMEVLLNPGDEAVTHTPCWPSIPEQVKLAGAKPVLVHAHAEDGFEVAADAIIGALTPRTKVIILNTPCNPTGALISEEALAAIGEEAARRGIWILVDLCYERLIYDKVPHNVCRILSERARDLAVMAGSASKAYAMTGWRCGWAIGPAPVIAACGVLQSHSTSNVCSITQRAALAALTGPQAPVKEMLEEYRVRRDRLHEWLSQDPRLTCRKPGGAFYLFLNVVGALEATGIRTSAEFARTLLDDARLALTPGEAFEAPGFIRISYATSMDRLREGATRLLEFVRRRERTAVATGA